MTPIARRIILACVVTMTALTRADVIDSHPNAPALKAVFAVPPAADFKPTGVTRADYLKLIAGNVDFFVKCQDGSGAIVDPVSKGERQYSTPAFAAAAGVLVEHAGRKDLLGPATKALTHALDALLAKNAADNHPDFFIPMLVHAYRSLKDAVPAGQAQAWAAKFKKLDPEKAYRADLVHMNWNIVSSSGELLRRHDGLVDPAMADRQTAYLEKCLAGHLATFKPIGLCEDPGVPMAYDAFSRLWLEDVFADNAYTGPNAEKIGTFLRTGGLTTLLVISPTGEWATGGRSSMHNWTDAQALAICEMNAAYWQKQNRPDVAGAFKRAAHLAFQSIQRWQRPSGELNIIKNRAEPEKRFAYETYSNHSQYNLLPMAMLAIAHARADDTIAEKPSPSEVGGYVLDARETFHKIFAAAGGYYVEIDTAADGHYDATGLQRVHRAGVPYSALNDTSAPERKYGDKNAATAAIATGLRWQTADGAWIGLADHVGGKGRRTVTSATLKVDVAEPKLVGFEIAYTLADADAGGRVVTERYAIASDGVVQTSQVSGSPAAIGVQVPAVLNDGRRDANLNPGSDVMSITRDGCTTLIAVDSAVVSKPWQLVGRPVITHGGSVRAATAELSGSIARIDVRLRRD